MANECSHCGTPVGPGSVVRLVGRDHAGNVVETCTKCWLDRRPEKSPTLSEVSPPKAKSSSKKRR